MATFTNEVWKHPGQFLKWALPWVREGEGCHYILTVTCILTPLWELGWARMGNNIKVALGIPENSLALTE